MSVHITAIYEHGVLRPLELPEHEVVSIVVNSPAENGRDDEYAPLVAEEADSTITWEQVQAVLNKLPGSLTEDVNRARDERV